MLAFTPLLASLTTPIDKGAIQSEMQLDILSDLAAYMGKELGSNRVMVPALQTAWRLAVALTSPVSKSKGTGELDET